MCSEMKFFQKARPVWAKGRETELNVTLVFRAVCPRRSEAKLAVTGCAYYNIYVNGTFLAVGPARAAHGYRRVDILPLNLDREQNEIRIIVMGYACNSFYHTDEPSFLTAEIDRKSVV